LIVNCEAIWLFVFADFLATCDTIAGQHTPCKTSHLTLMLKRHPVARVAFLVSEIEGV